jgi:hypothetical protein
LCLANGIFKSDNETPIYITPIHFQWIIKNQSFQIEPIWENTFVNPWLEKYLQTYGQEIEFNKEISIEENIENLESNQFFQKQNIIIEKYHFV